MARSPHPPPHHATRRSVLAAGAALTLWGCGDAATGLAPPSRVTGPDTHPVAWVFSSGGPRGFVHVGVASAMLGLGLRPDLVMGASIGALVACMVAAGLDAQRLRAAAMDVDMADLIRPTLQPPWLGLNPLAGWVRKLVGGRPLESLGTPCAVLAIHAGTRRPVVFNAGDTGLAVQAACAIEDRFVPVQINGHPYADADLVMPLPVRMAFELGARHVLAVDASAHEDKAPEGTELWRPADLRKRALTQADATHADLVLHPDTGYYAGFSQDYRQHSIATGEDHVRTQVLALKALHERARSLA